MNEFTDELCISDDERTLIIVVLRVAYLQVQRGHTVPAVRDGEESSV